MHELLEAIDRLDLDGAMALFAPGARLLTADGRRADGGQAVRALLGDFLSMLRSTTHTVTAEWHAENAWIAEVDAVYEFTDGFETAVLPRACVLLGGSEGLSDVHVYGAHERPRGGYGEASEGLRVGGRWIPPL
jgi:hypothetical protein